VTIMSYILQVHLIGTLNENIHSTFIYGKTEARTGKTVFKPLNQYEN
jgi:hypothetical protein